MLVAVSKATTDKAKGTPEGVPSISLPVSDDISFSNDPECKLNRILGQLHQHEAKHFYSHGTFNSVRLLFHVLEQIGPADIIMSTYSISEKSARQLWAAQDKGLIKNIRFLIDNRVRSMSPKPFQALNGFFPGNVKTTSIHAKVTTLESDQWQVSIISSMNATDNNKIERGVINTHPDVFHFDKRVLDYEFERGSD